jgi:hypothetical protein
MSAPRSETLGAVYGLVEPVAVAGIGARQDQMSAPALRASTAA